MLRFFDYDKNITITEELVEEIYEKHMAMIEAARPIEEFAMNVVLYSDSMSRLDDEARAKGYEDGYAQQYAAEYTEGFAIGVREAQLEVSENMLRDGYSAEFIHKCTKLPIEEIRELAKKIGAELVE